MEEDTRRWSSARKAEATGTGAHKGHGTMHQGSGLLQVRQGTSGGNENVWFGQPVWESQLLWEAKENKGNFKIRIRIITWKLHKALI